MKDALGHGSDSQGGTPAHQSGVNTIGKFPKNMRRAHFEEIASGLKAQNAPLERIQEVANAIAGSNRLFNRERFIAAAQTGNMSHPGGMPSRASSRARVRSSVQGKF